MLWLLPRPVSHIQKLKGTIHETVEKIEAVGSKGLACVVDVRNPDLIQAAVDKAVETFGGIDILVNNASAISLTGTLQTKVKRYDLMHQVNVRGTFCVHKRVCRIC